MDPNVISPKIQEFAGLRFYKGGKYFRHVVNRSASLLLHRVVWEHHNGPIPAGCHVHHHDGDPANNRIDNLRAMKRGEHLSLHWTPEKRRWAAENVVKRAMPAARQWHKSPEGQEWHRKYGLEQRGKSKKRSSIKVTGAI